jgi:hypothetical protein
MRVPFLFFFLRAYAAYITMQGKHTSTRTHTNAYAKDTEKKAAPSKLQKGPLQKKKITRKSFRAFVSTGDAALRQLTPSPEKTKRNGPHPQIWESTIAQRL